MSRIWYAIAVFWVATNCIAQEARAPELPDGQGTDADVRHSTTDPKAVEIPLYKGALIKDVLTALSLKGFKIKWNPEQVLPNMTVLEKPSATRIDNMLNEILAPWGMRADHNLQDGGYRVKPVKKKKSD